MIRIYIFSCPIDALDMQATIAEIETCIHNRILCQHVVVNVAKIVEMQKNKKLRQIVSDCHIINADGMPLVWAARLLKKPLPGRVAGVDLFQELVEVCSEKGYRPFFLGARERVVKEMVQQFSRKFPGLNIAGFRNGYFTDNEELHIADSIKKSRADMLFVGFSSPMKEEFLNKWMPHMNVPFCMGVGGSFDIVAGRTKRAPFWMQRLGLEWAFRIYQEPRRMWKRYATTNPMFIWMLVKELIKNRKNQ